MSEFEQMAVLYFSQKTILSICELINSSFFFFSTSYDYYINMASLFFKLLGNHISAWIVNVILTLSYGIGMLR